MYRFYSFQLPIHPMIVKLLACMFVAPNTNSCVQYGKMLAFLGLALKRMPRIPDLTDAGAPPPLPASIRDIMVLLPRSGLPDRPLVLSQAQRDEIRAQLSLMLKHSQPEAIMNVLDELMDYDKRGTGVVTLHVIKEALKRGKVSDWDHIDLIPS